MEYTVRIIAITLVFGFVFFKLSDYIAEIFTKDEKTVYIFGITPIFYYIFDYISAVYTDYRFFKIQGGVEFLALFLCVAFLVFCFVYHKEYEEKADVKRKEQIIRITVEEQKKELETVKRGEQIVRILRHDMRLLLFNLSTCIENDDKITAQKMISSFVENID